MTTLEVVVERIDNMKKEFHEKIDHQTDDINKRIDLLTVQVQKTNGGVTSLKLWRSFIVGGLAVITAIVIPVALLFIADYLSKKL